MFYEFKGDKNPNTLAKIRKCKLLSRIYKKARNITNIFFILMKWKEFNVSAVSRIFFVIGEKIVEFLRFRQIRELPHFACSFRP